MTALVVPDVTSVDASIRFDVAQAVAEVTAQVAFTVPGPEGGHPALDLRQRVDLLRLDGRQLDGEAFSPRDLGGGEGAEVRILDVAVEPRSRHVLEVGYRLERPDVAQAIDVGWEDSGVRFDLWMSDLHPGRYLEQWIPAPLVGDRFALSLEVEVRGTDRPHVAVANCPGGDATAGLSWELHYPAHFTALSPMLVIAPADAVEVRRRPVVLAGRGEPVELLCARHIEVDADLAVCEADVASWLGYGAERYGPWAHGPRCTAFVWESGRGMEYDGATTAAVEALEHEVFHSWFGRGVKPATASDGWIDEAFTAWATASRRVEHPRFLVEELGLDEDPVVLYPPHPWSRYTPVEAYAQGARLFAGVAWLLGGAGRLRSAMAAWYQANRGGLITTDGLEAHLRTWSGVEVGPWFDRYVHGRG
ncbi:MAG: hypothetical protein J2P57_10615 [Acidimicrobiaceae bacterium]|nr:hypothetical protein [Acidimicrobiaceae bacterium]